LRTRSEFSHRAMLVSAVLAFCGVSIVPTPASAGFLDFMFKTNNAPSSARHNGSRARAITEASAQGSRGRTSGYCVRSCDGRYFVVQARGDSSPAQMCEAFCPASPTRVYFGSNIDNAMSATGQRYASSENAFAYRKALKADCTCNGHDPVGLAPVDLSFDTTLRSGDIVATTEGPVTYSETREGGNRTAEFTPVVANSKLTADVRTRLSEMKVAPLDQDFPDRDFRNQNSPDNVARLHADRLPQATPLDPSSSSNILRSSAAAPIARRAALD
jgi:hypothetical protein